MSKQSDLVSVSQGSGGDPLYIDTTNDRVGVGTTSPTSQLDLYNATTAKMTVRSGDGSAASVKLVRIAENDTSTDWELKNAGGTFKIIGDNTSQNEFSCLDIETLTTKFYTNNTERVRIDSSGNLLVGKTSSSFGATGIELKADNQFRVTRSGVCASLNRLSTDGVIADFYGPSGLAGAIGNNGPRMFIGTADTGLFFADDLDSVTPWNPSTNGLRDNAIDLGWASGRFDDIYATNGTIQTSDRNEKQDIEALSDAEQRVAVAAKGLLRKYRWKDAVAEKGDAARIHFGIIAQDLQAAFEAEGLDAGRYGMFISSTWWEAEVEKTREVEQEDGTTITETYTATETYDEATEGATERTRLGVRYPELLAFIIAAL